MQRILSNHSVLVAVMLLFAGCSSNNPSSDRPNSNSDASVKMVDGADVEGDLPRDTDAVVEPKEDVALDLPFDVSEEPCRLGETRCIDEGTHEYCERGRWVREQCEPQRFVCFENRGCVRLICEPGTPAGCDSVTRIAICDETGTNVTLEACPEGLRCRYADARFQCTNTVCDPGEIRCIDTRQVETCDSDGQGWTAGALCDEAEQCDEGECRSLCEINNKVSSFLGCEYWSIDLDNIEGGQEAPHAVILSNPTELTAQIEVFDAVGEPIVVEGWPTTVEPGGLATWLFDPAFINTTTGASLLDPGQVDGSVIVRQSFRFVANVPVTAHQFNPLVDDENVFTNDASLLLPSNALGTDYLVMSWKHRFERNFSLRGFMTVVAVAEGTTLVQVVVTTGVVSGSDAERSGRTMTRMYPGDQREYLLERGEVLNLETAGPSGEDLTGSSIVSDKPIAVFGGHECGNVQLGINRCDHIETQLAPLSTWGTLHVATKFSPRNREPDIWRVLAGASNVVITTTPRLPGVDGVALEFGQYIEFEALEHMVIRATGPVSIGHYMVGSNWNGARLVCNDSTGNTGIGDPAMTILPPLGQFRDNYIILTPAGYDEDYLNVIVQEGTQVALDGVAIAPEMFQAIGETGFAVAVLEVSAGPHTVTGDRPFGLEVYGYGCHVSYAYPGGMNLEAINDP